MRLALRGPVPGGRNGVLKWLSVAAVTALLFAPAAAAGPREYAHQLTIAKWRSVSEWEAVDRIVSAESGWDPCSSWPGRRDCSYAGPNSCGIPQANPCPPAWRGRLAVTWRKQVRWLVWRYIPHRYGTPTAALRFRQTHGWF